MLSMTDSLNYFNMREHLIVWILMGGYIAIVLGIGTWAIIHNRKKYQKHKEFLKFIRVNDTVKYNGISFEILDITHNPYSGKPVAFKVKSEGWLHDEHFGYLRPINKTK